MNDDKNRSRYVVIKRIGHGGMANVYLANDIILNRQVAIKLLNPESAAKDNQSLQRFLLEAHATTSLIHPNIVEVYDICDIDDKHFIVMEYVEGHTLKDIIKMRGCIPVKESVFLMKQLCSGIMEAHKNGIIHRDIKPQNILMKNDGTAKIADFGIAVLNNNTELTSKNTVLGSVHYLAPELSRGDSPSMKSDIYSLGIVFFEMLSGRVPFNADNNIAVALKHFKEPLPDLKKINPNIPQSIINIILKATAKDPSERYENVALMLKDINDCLNFEHANDSIVKLNKSKLEMHNEMFPKISNHLNNEYRKSSGILYKLFIILIAICSLATVCFLLMISGVINFGFNTEVEVPDIINMNLTEAKDYLSDFGLNLDTANIERQLSDNVPENNIIKVIPNVGSNVDKGSKIQVIVSDGKYYKIDDYIGKNIDEISKKVLSTKIILHKIPIDSDAEPGTIVSQEPDPGTKYNPKEIFEITVKYSKFNSFTLSFDYRGKNIDDIINVLSANGIKVEKICKNKSDFSEAEQNSFAPHTLIYSEPALGTIYTQDVSNSLKIYYYDNDE